MKRKDDFLRNFRPAYAVGATHEEPGTFCLDLFIGEERYLNKGYGTEIVKTFVQKLLTEFKAKKIVLDPASSNKRAIRCYEKAGFVVVKKEHDGANECYGMEFMNNSIEVFNNLEKQPLELLNNHYKISSKEQSALDWALKYLKLEKSTTAYECNKIAATSYSIVYKIQILKNSYYLKQTPQALFTEPQILNFLTEHGCKNIPLVVATNNNLRCFLMTASGDISLRKYFNGNIDLDMLKQGIANYTSIQRSMEKYTTELLGLGVPDWRLDKFSTLYYQLIQQEQLLLDDGLSKTEILQLQQLHSVCFKLCNELAQYKLPETICHCDFHENNILLDQKTHTINIIDWGETVIAHPFFSLQGCLWHISYFYNAQLTEPMSCELQKQYIAPWLNFYSETQLLQALTLASKLSGIFAALSFTRLYLATKNQLRLEHNCPIAGCLRSFLQAVGSAV